ncbi:hypothetical protein L9F63_008578, partial [Diploptera punctata]
VSEFLFEIGHEASIRSKRTPEGFTHDWELFVRGADNTEINHFVEKVVFYLHNTFPKPVRVVKEPPYSVKESGYAGFNLQIEIYFRSDEEPKKVRYNYDLHLQTSGPSISKVQREKYVFRNPDEDLRRRLIRGGGVITSTTDDTPSKSSSTQLVSKPKLGGDATKKHKVKEHRSEEPRVSNNSFEDFFGVIKKPSPSTKVPSLPKPSKPPEKANNDKLSSSTKPSKHSSMPKESSGSKTSSSSGSSSVKEEKKDKNKERDKSKDKEKSKHVSTPPKLTPSSKPSKEEPKKSQSDEHKAKSESKSPGESSKSEKKKKDKRSKDEKSKKEKHKEHESKSSEKPPKETKDKEKDKEVVKKPEKESSKESEKPRDKEKSSGDGEKERSRHKHKKKEREKREESNKDRDRDKEKKAKKSSSESKKSGEIPEKHVPAPPPPPVNKEKSSKKSHTQRFEENEPNLSPLSADEDSAPVPAENKTEPVMKPDVQNENQVSTSNSKVDAKPKSESYSTNKVNSSKQKDKSSSRKSKDKKDSVSSNVKEESTSKTEKESSKKRKRKSSGKVKEEDEGQATKLPKLDLEVSKSSEETEEITLNCSECLNHYPVVMKEIIKTKGYTNVSQIIILSHLEMLQLSTRARMSVWLLELATCPDFLHTQKSVHAIIIVKIPKLPGETSVMFLMLSYTNCGQFLANITKKLLSCMTGHTVHVNQLQNSSIPQIVQSFELKLGR